MAKTIARGFLVAAFLLMAQRANGAVSASADGGSLTVTSDDGSDTISVTCPAGNVLVNGADPMTGAVACAGITSIAISGGGGADIIEVNTILRSQFSSIPSVSIDGGDGDDVIRGSIFNDTLLGGNGNDKVYGNVGDDDIDTGDGNDLGLGNEGNDTLRLAPSSSPHHLDGGSGDDRLVFQGSTGADSVQLSWDGVVSPDGEIHYSVTVAGAVTRSATVEAFELFLDEGDDVVTGYLFAGTQLFLHGGPGNNTLTWDGKCSPASLTADSFSQETFKAATFDGFASATVENSFAFAQAQLDVAATATEAKAQLETGASCAWTATSDVGWIGVAGGESGVGPAELSLTLTPNTDAAPRSGKVTVNGSVLTVVQAGGASSGGDGGAGSGDGGNGNADGGGSVTTSTEVSGTAKKRGCTSQPPTALATAMLMAAMWRRRRKI